jgi:Flp pilus assembly protein TadD
MMSLAVLLLASEPSTAAFTEAPATQQIAFIEAALDQGRLVQAGAMIDRLRQQAGYIRPNPALIVQEARLALIERRDDEALTAFDAVLVGSPKNCTALEGAGVAATRLRDFDRALRRLETATQNCAERWRVWNALGVVADQQQDWEKAEKAYQTAARLSPGNAEILNNHGYSLMLRRQFDGAARMFEAARRLAPDSLRIANNLDVARASAGKNIDVSSARESKDQLAKRLNNAGYAALMSGDAKTAQSYFDRAVSLSGSYFKRASDNLDLAKQENGSTQ